MALENIRENRDIRLVTKEERRKLFSDRTKLSHNQGVFATFISN